MGPLQKAKLRIAYRIERAVAMTYRPQPWGCGEEWDSDQVAKLIASHLPLSVAEAEELVTEWNEEHKRKNPGPSLFAQLRELVHATPEMSINTVLEAAIAKLRERT